MDLVPAPFQQSFDLKVSSPSPHQLLPHFGIPHPRKYQRVALEPRSMPSNLSSTPRDQNVTYSFLFLMEHPLRTHRRSFWFISNRNRMQSPLAWHSEHVSHQICKIKLYIFMPTCPRFGKRVSLGMVRELRTVPTYTLLFNGKLPTRTLIR